MLQRALEKAVKTDLDALAQERLIERAISVSRATIKGTLVIGVIQGTLGASQRAVISDFMNTDELGNPSDFNTLSGNALINRIEASVGLLLSSPEFQFQ